MPRIAFAGSVIAAAPADTDVPVGAMEFKYPWKALEPGEVAPKFYTIAAGIFLLAQGTDSQGNPTVTVDSDSLRPDQQARQTTDGKFDVIVVCFGPVFWILTQAVRDERRDRPDPRVQAILARLSPGGTLFFAAPEGILVLNRGLERCSAPGVRLAPFPPHFDAMQSPPPLRCCGRSASDL